MSPIRPLLRLLAGLGLATLLAGPATAANDSLKPGDPFPNLTRYKLAGALPEGWQGKVLLVDFWASWCAPCKTSFPVMDELQKTYGPRGFLVIAVNVDEKAADMEAFLRKTPAHFTVVRDVEQKLVAAANAATMPTSFVVDATGRVRFLHSGYHGGETRAKYREEIESLLK
jgi:thiol-disulfide isomerase/thioredoxin